MKKRNRNIFEIKRGILKCKKRLDALKNQGFIFSQDIYDNLDLLEKKIIESSLIRQIWNKKLPLFAGIIIIFSIIMLLNIFFPHILTDVFDIEETKIKEIMDIAVNNVHNGMVIDKNITIIGTASYPNGNILSVHVIIDEEIWENATGTNQWYYQLNIDEFDDGNHTLSFLCSDGKDVSIIERKILIDKRPIPENAPTVTIQYPNNVDGISGIKNINGTATAGVGEIQKVEIQFDGSDWIIVTGKTTWQYNWDTKTVENGLCYISVRSYDNESQSKIDQIIVNVDNPPKVIIPDIEGVDTYQLYIFGSDEVMKPNETYTGQGFHRKKEEIFSRDTLIRLEVTNKYDWLTVSLPDQPIVTPPDYVLYNFSIDISITDDAPMNSRGKFTITATYGPRFRFNLDLLLNQDLHDIDFYTGQWKNS